ncbi:MAG: hypothetical protein AB7N91_01945 [Candidatus Tectimicrobiota bacterium]
MREELLQLADVQAVEAQSRKLGHDKCEPCQAIPLLHVGIEVVVDPKIGADWPCPGWDDGALGHTWLRQACKQDKPCLT